MKVYFITVYFVDPSTICPSSSDRTTAKHQCSSSNRNDVNGCFKPRAQTAEALYIQNGPSAGSTIFVPLSQDEIDVDIEQVN